MEFPVEQKPLMSTPAPKRTSFIRSVIFSGLLLILGGVAGYRIRELRPNLRPDSLSSAQSFFQVLKTEQPNEYKSINFAQFWEVWKLLEQNYVDPTQIKNDQMVYGAIKGMTASIGDPYTLYLPPTDQKRSQEDLQGSFYGVGIELGYIEGTPAIMSVIQDMPAEKAGLMAKDVILHIKDEGKKLDVDTTDMTLDKVVEHIRGEKGTSVTLTIFRKEDPAKQPVTFTLQRGEIIVPSTKITFEEKDGRTYAHIVLSKFGERTESEMNSAILEIQKHSPAVSGIILDMRNNPGGLLTTGINVASEFIDSGLIVTQQGKISSKNYEAEGKARLANYPLVVVVNGGSASAAEIVAGALRDRRDAELIGEKTFGKGTVQDALQLENGAGLHITIAKWLLPKGEWINQTGIPVNVEVKDDVNTPEDEVLLKALEEVGKK